MPRILIFLKVAICLSLPATSRVQQWVLSWVLSALSLLMLILPLDSKAQDTKLLSRGQDNRIFLLGEIHDNIHAHQQRLDFVKRLIN